MKCGDGGGGGGVCVIFWCWKVAEQKKKQQPPPLPLPPESKLLKKCGHNVKTSICGIFSGECSHYVHFHLCSRRFISQNLQMNENLLLLSLFIFWILLNVFKANFIDAKIFMTICQGADDLLWVEIFIFWFWHVGTHTYICIHTQVEL